MPFLNIPSQENLLQGCSQNDRQKQELLYKQYCPDMWALCISNTLNVEIATDVLQQGFLKIFRDIQFFDPATSSLHDWMQKQMLETGIENGMKLKNSSAGEVNISTEKKDSDAELIQRMTEGEMLQVFHALPELTKSVYHLYTEEGYTHAEIAAFLDISEDASIAHLNDAKKHFSHNIKIS
jgi:RNA polymerase sigma-70 factor (ECF subfamily)